MGSSSGYERWTLESSFLPESSKLCCKHFMTHRVLQQTSKFVAKIKSQRFDTRDLATHFNRLFQNPSSYLLAPRVLQHTFEAPCKTNFDTLCHPGFATNLKVCCNAQVAMLCHPGFCSKLQKFVAEAKYLVFDTQGFATNFRSSLQNQFRHFMSSRVLQRTPQVGCKTQEDTF